MTWTFKNIKFGGEWDVDLIAVSHPNFESISDDNPPSEISAEGMFALWTERVRKEYSDGLIPVSWSVELVGERKSTEFLPFQHQHWESKLDDFLSYFTWPVDSETGQPLDWLKLQVADQAWSVTDWKYKGGFIQAATGWKPSIYQPYLPLDSVEAALGGLASVR